MEKDGWRRWREKRDGRKPHRDKGWLIWHCRTFGSFVLQWILIDSVFGRHFGGGPNLLFLSTEWIPRIGRINREDWNISGTKEAVVQIWSKGSRGLSQIGLNVWLPRESRARWESQEHCLSTISEQIFSTCIVTNIVLALHLHCHYCSCIATISCFALLQEHWLCAISDQLLPLAGLPPSSPSDGCQGGDCAGKRKILKSNDFG